MIPPLDKVHNGEQPARKLDSTDRAHNQIHTHTSTMSSGSQLNAFAIRPTVRGFTSSPRMIRVSVCGLVPLRKSVSAIHRRASIMLSFPTLIFTVFTTHLEVFSNHFGCSVKSILPNRLFVNYAIKKIFQNGCFLFSNRVIYNRGDGHVDNWRAYKKSS